MQADSQRRSTPLGREPAPGHRTAVARLPVARLPWETPAPRLASVEQLKLNLLNQIERLEQDIAQLRTRLHTIDAASAPLEPAPVRRRNTTPRPALAPLILSLLPDDGTLRPIDDIITGMLEAEHIAIDDRPARSKAYRRANLCLHKLRTDGQVISHRIGNGRLDWGRDPGGAALADQGDA